MDLPRTLETVQRNVISTPEGQLGSQVASTDSRLLRAVGKWGLAAGIVNITIGGGIFRLPASVYALIGAASPLAYVICAALMGLIVVCFAEAGSRVSLTGGLYAYVEVAFGPLIGFVSGVLLWAGMTAAVSAVAVFLGDAIAALVPALASPPMHATVIVLVLVGLAMLNIAGVEMANRFNGVMTVAKLLPLGIVIVAGLLALKGRELAVVQAPAAHDVSRASILLMFAFLGVESALVPSGEVKDPARTVPAAIAIAMTVVVIVYLCVQLVSQSALGAALGASRTPVADAAGVLLGSWGRTLVLAGSALSMFGYVGGMTLAVPRMLYAFGRDGFLMKGMASVHARFRTPYVAIAVQTILNILLATTGTFERLAIAANGSILFVYAACAFAVIQLRRKNVRSAGDPFVPPLGVAIPVLALAAIGWLLFSLKRQEWIAMGSIAAAGLAIFVGTRSSRNSVAE